MEYWRSEDCDEKAFHYLRVEISGAQDYRIMGTEGQYIYNLFLFEAIARGSQ